MVQRMYACEPLIFHLMFIGQESIELLGELFKGLLEALFNPLPYCGPCCVEVRAALGRIMSIPYLWFIVTFEDPDLAIRIFGPVNAYVSKGRSSLISLK